MEIKRYVLLDFIRGTALINMIIYHLIWDVVHLFGVKIGWYTGAAGYVWQQLICCTFIFLSGFCWDMGRKKLKRGIVTLAASFLITAITAAFMPENIILFGVLTLIGSAAIIMIPLEKALVRVNPYAGLGASWVLFVLTRYIARGGISLGDFELLTVPDSWYSGLFSAYLGFPPESFVSQDYFPVIPWMLLYVSGYFLFRIARDRGWMHPLTCSISRPVEWCGRNSLIIYMLHQPIIYAVLKIIFH